MANPFYTKTFDVTPGNLVRSQTLEDQFLLVEQGFDNVNTNLVTKASPTTTGTGSHTGNFTITGNETVTGGVSIGGTLSVGTSLSVGTNLTVGGSETVTGGMSVGGAITAGGKVTAGAGPSASLDLTTKDYVDSLVTATAFSTSLPLQSGNAGKFVTTNGTSASWAFAGIAQVTTATTATTLTNTPTLLQITPTAPGVTVTLPDATTCPVGGPHYCIDNRSSFPVRIANSTGALIGFAGPQRTTLITLDDKSTAAGIWSGSWSKVGWAASLTLGTASRFSNSNLPATCVALDADRTFIGWSTGSAYYGSVYRRSTNAFSSATLIRTVASASNCASVLVTTNTVLFVSCPSSSTAVQGVALSINASTDAITVNTAANFTAAAAITAFGSNATAFNQNVLVAPPGASGSAVLAFATGTAAYIVAFSVSGTTTTVGSATTLGGTVNPNIVASADKVIATSYTTTTGSFNVYTISGTTITTGTGGTVASVTRPAQLQAWGSRFLVIWAASSGTAFSASLLSLSGTTLTASTVTGVVGGSTSTAVDVQAVGSTKMLVVGDGNTPGAVNLLTDSSGTLSAGTASTVIAGSGGKAIALVNGNSAYVIDQGFGAWTFDCSGSSVSDTSVSYFTANTVAPYTPETADGRSFSGAVGAAYKFQFSAIGAGTLFLAFDTSALQPVAPEFLPPTSNTTFGVMNPSYRNQCWLFNVYGVQLLECVA